MGRVEKLADKYQKVIKELRRIEADRERLGKEIAEAEEALADLQERAYLGEPVNKELTKTKRKLSKLRDDLEGLGRVQGRVEKRRGELEDDLIKARIEDLKEEKRLLIEHKRNLAEQLQDLKSQVKAVEFELRQMNSMQAQLNWELAALELRQPSEDDFKQYRDKLFAQLLSSTEG